ncbi:M20 family metallopeptidase [Brevibacillus fulvus]|uniref:Acetylornithine deacetylase/succinyl-diaminopimelate desuccinylase-like protein n=1 Tax=Brevibacillus fulvus TaxID=1125967 RepID=A0A938Y4P9_9BACL|nr:M20/M25/M40 family metallo-hydrolase [Brevibacillus fulvus]MBM7591552.1 acetylornithine deacetylase/succinyl-diaminopimelate desuccinylase-like protein [Brevibacillus fulvus]
MQDVFDFIDRNKEEYISWLQEICRQPSVAAQNRGMKETAAMVEKKLKELGAETMQVETSGYPVVYGVLGQEKSKTLSFYNHYDVQPEDPLELWESPPFAAEIRDGRIYARGVADNKGNLLARLAAVHAFQKVRGSLPLQVKFVVEGEEEIGSVHLEEFVEHHRDLLQADGCLWEFGYKNADGRPQVSLGVKGMCYVELRCKGANTDLHSANAAIIENPAWRLIWALSTLKTPDEKVQIEGFYDKVAALTEADRDVLEKMIYSEESTLEKLGLDSFLLNLSGLPLKEKLIFQPTCTICGIESGYTGEGSKTVLPSEARVKIDFRLVPDQDPHEIRNLLRKHLDKHGFSDIEIHSFTLEHPARTEIWNPLAASVLGTAEQIYGMEPTVMPMSPGTGPMYVLCQSLGIPAVSVGVGNFASNNHAPNENILVDDYIQGIKHIAAIIEDFAKRGDAQ